MNIKERHDNFIKRAIEKHSTRFDYSRVKYNNQKTKIEIICPLHGSFFQTPDKHLQCKHACIKCFKNNRIKPKTKKPKQSKYNIQYSREKLINKYQNKFTYDFSNFTPGVLGIVNLICEKHGDNIKSLQSLLLRHNKYGCNKCAEEARAKYKTHSYESLVETLKEKHKNKYLYPISNKKTYINKKSIISIYCEKHGLFKKKAQKHLSGQGCIQCMYDNLVINNKLPGGYIEYNFINNDELSNKPAILYYLKINKGKFYKIGITTNLENRLKGIKSKCKSKKYIVKIEVLQTLQDTLYNCFKLEQYILNTYSEYRSPRRWSTEIFDQDILKNIDLQSIKVSQ